MSRFENPKRTCGGCVFWFMRRTCQVGGSVFISYIITRPEIDVHITLTSLHVLQKCNDKHNARHQIVTVITRPVIVMTECIFCTIMTVICQEVWIHVIYIL